MYKGFIIVIRPYTAVGGWPSEGLMGELEDHEIPTHQPGSQTHPVATVRPEEADGQAWGNYGLSASSYASADEPGISVKQEAEQSGRGA